jgi:16S rRNA (guanine1207-N2)-methyltransferase|tara:strand:- start:2809 stop:3450 length:642 start_codon:yes stop_codon:yes gene_type:complete
VSDGQYWTDSPGVASRPSEVDLLLPDVDLRLTTDRGVFSADRVDRGTRYLLLEGPDLPTGPVDLLDLGCGYGPIACTLASRRPEARVWAVDVNERARDLCRANAAAAGLANVEVAAPDDVPVDVRLAAIWSNPPIRIGKPALHDLLTRWLDLLTPDGTAHLVVQRHLGADSLARWLDDRGWATERRGSRKGFRLLDVAARAEPPTGAAADGAT